MSENHDALLYILRIAGFLFAVCCVWLIYARQKTKMKRLKAANQHSAIVLLHKRHAGNIDYASINAILHIDVQGLHDIARQRGCIGGIMPPGTETDAVIARQAIVGSDPQIAGAVAGQRGNRGIGQAIGRAQHPEARDLGHGGLRRDTTSKAQSQQPDP